MTKDRGKNEIMATVNDLAALVRSRGTISFGEVLALRHLAPSTLYGYVRALTAMCKDIKYKNGVFVVEEACFSPAPEPARLET